MTQSEAQLEEGLLHQLESLGYERVHIANLDDLHANLKKQLEKHNHVRLSNNEFNKVLNHLNKGNVFARAKALRGRIQITRNNGTPLYLRFLNTDEWCKNEYQVTNQVTVEGKYKNRYDVTILINGLPLTQIELKRRGMELKEAFNQINRYQRHSYWADSGLFQYVQIFVISNGVNTKYYANNRDQDFKQTFYWSDAENNLITNLEDFTNSFLEKCHLSKIICRYTVLHESNKVLMVLRPYQYYAVEAIVNRVGNGLKNGYIWHTTGSGKTLTSFKAAQILIRIEKIDKVLFVVDRADLDYQTTKEFNCFSDGCVDGTNNTKSLVQQLSGDNKLIVTTIQKLNTAITKDHYLPELEPLQKKRVIFIFDECHRSQFGRTHKNIISFFKRAQLFGFTGTPIFAENVSSNEFGKRTTADLFEDCLHKYVITNAIKDENVLKFSIEYWGKLRHKDGRLIDEQVPAINIKEFFDNEDRIENIIDWIIANHNRKTHDGRFSAMMCVSSVDALIKYYDIFKRKKDAGTHDLRVVTIFTYSANEEDIDADGLIGDPDFDFNSENSVNTHSRDKLEEFINDYNSLYNTNFTCKDSQGFYNYYKDIAKRMKERDRKDFKDQNRADILLVVNMYLTGFDAKKLNTLYVDKNLKYHGLIQAYSRTNRILGDLKSQGNIVCFRNLKENTDKAIALFSNKDAEEKVLLDPYETYVDKFNNDVIELKIITPTPKEVDLLASEEDKLFFVRAFRQLIRTLNVLKSFTQFTFADLNLKEQEFEDYKSKYLDIYDISRPEPGEEGASIINEVDFELELIHRDEINVAYILDLLEQLLKEGSYKDKLVVHKRQKKAIMDFLGKEVNLRSKRELIEKFIENYMTDASSNSNIKHGFVDFWNFERSKAVDNLCQDMKMDNAKISSMIEQIHFSGKKPLREAVFSALTYKPKLMERKKIYDKVISSIMEIIKVFDDNLGDLK